MFLINLFRILIGIACAMSIILMVAGFARHHHGWNSKTRDYWYGRLMWTVVGVSSAVEGIARGTAFRYTLIFMAAAALATLKGNLQKGTWGTDSDD